jgi:hypothetical protein
MPEVRCRKKDGAGTRKHYYMTRLCFSFSGHLSSMGVYSLILLRHCKCIAMCYLFKTKQEPGIITMGIKR